MRRVRLGQTALGGRPPLEGTATVADLRLAPEDLGAIDAIFADAVPMSGPHPKGM